MKCDTQTGRGGRSSTELLATAVRPRKKYRLQLRIPLVHSWYIVGTSCRCLPPPPPFRAGGLTTVRRYRTHIKSSSRTARQARSHRPIPVNNIKNAVRPEAKKKPKIQNWRQKKKIKKIGKRKKKRALKGISVLTGRARREIVESATKLGMVGVGKLHLQKWRTLGLLHGWSEIIIYLNRDS